MRRIPATSTPVPTEKRGELSGGGGWGSARPRVAALATLCPTICWASCMARSARLPTSRLPEIAIGPGGDPSDPLVEDLERRASRGGAPPRLRGWRLGGERAA